jgi:transposase
LLTSVPGIGQVLATTILLETGPIERFDAVVSGVNYFFR